MSSADAGWRYLADHGVPVPDDPPDAAALAELRVIRTLVQRLLVAGLDPWTADGRALLAGARFVLDAGGHVTDAEPGWRGFCRDLLPPLLALVAAGVPLRSCSNPACRLVFEDGTRNHGRRWCDTAGCGNRDRVRRARGRETTAAVS